MPSVPTGSFDADPTDLISVSTDGIVWWHPRLLSDTPGDPVAVTTVRLDIPTHFPSFGGFVNGSLLLHDGDMLQPTHAYIAPGATPIEVFDGRRLAVSPNGARVVADVTGGLAPGWAIYDWQDRRTLRISTTGAQFHWMPNSRDLVFINFADGNVSFERRSATLEWTLIDHRVVLDQQSLFSDYPARDPDLVFLLGVWGDQLAGALRQDDQTEVFLLHSDDFGMPATEPWWPPDTLDVSPDGSARLTVGPRVDDLTVEFRDGRASIPLVNTADAFFVPPPFVTGE